MFFHRLFFVGVRPLFIVFGGLQVLDYASTKLALATGLAEEKNDFLNFFSEISAAPIGATILVSKIIIMGLIVLAVMRSRDGLLDRALLATACAYYVLVCFLNLYWAFTLA
jgi:uncharacterized membrane protein YqjE